jgi:hypothetical protein
MKRNNLSNNKIVSFSEVYPIEIYSDERIAEFERLNENELRPLQSLNLLLQRLRSKVRD